MCSVLIDRKFWSLCLVLSATSKPHLCLCLSSPSRRPFCDLSRVTPLKQSRNSSLRSTFSCNPSHSLSAACCSLNSHRIGQAAFHRLPPSIPCFTRNLHNPPSLHLLRCPGVYQTLDPPELRATASAPRRCSLLVPQRPAHLRSDDRRDS